MMKSIGKRLRVGRVGLAAIVLAATVATGASTAASLAAPPLGINLLPTPAELSKSTVAVISHVPFGLRTISTADLTRAMGQYAAVKFDLKVIPKRGQAKYEVVEKGALGEQLDRVWILGQAAEMGITASRKEVRTELTQIKKRNFKSAKQYRAYLRHSHYTHRDVLERIRLQVLATKMEERFSPKEFSKFVGAYEQRWRSRTVCADRYAIERCSNEPAS
jgi:SurA N-terminal domain